MSDNQDSQNGGEELSERDLAGRRAYEEMIKNKYPGNPKKTPEMIRRAHEAHMRRIEEDDFGVILD